MGTVARVHFNDILDDDTMGEFEIRTLISMLEDHLREEL